MDMDEDQISHNQNLEEQKRMNKFFCELNLPINFVTFVETPNIKGYDFNLDKF